MSDKPEIFYCQNCRRETNHDLLCDESQHVDLPDGFRIWKTYDLIRCMGCNTVAFHLSECHTATPDVHSQLLSAVSEYYPKGKNTRASINGIEYAPEGIRRIYDEVLLSLNHELPILSAAGLRALIESICRDRNYNWKGLYDGIETLSVDGILSFTQVEFLRACRFLGNSAIHELQKPSRDQLLSAVDIVEMVINSIYVLPHKASLIDRNQQNGT